MAERLYRHAIFTRGNDGLLVRARYLSPKALLLAGRASRSTGSRAFDTDRSASIGVTVTGVIPVIIVLATIALVAAQHVNVRLIENNPEKIVVDATCHIERMLHHVDLGAAPLYNKDVRVHQACRCAHVNDGCQRR